MKTVLVTGASGGVGTRLRQLLRGVYPKLRFSDITEPKDLGKDEEFIKADLGEMKDVEKIVAGVDGIVHLGGYSIEGPWEMIKRANIEGCYNLFEAARLAKVKRVVFASSNHTMGYYPRQRKVGINDYIRADSRYGVSKAFGEALGSMYAFKYGMRVTSLRIGNVGDMPLDRRRLAVWLKPEDLVQLVRIGLEHPDIHYEIFYGCSHNERAWWDNENAFRFGYKPEGKSEEHAAHALAEQAKLKPDAVGDWYQGGHFCSEEFMNGIERAPR